LRIGFFIPLVGRGGVESSLSKLIRALSGTDHDLTILYGEAPDDWLDAIGDSAELVQLQKKLPLPFVDKLVDTRAASSLALTRDLIRYLKQDELDVLVGYQSGAVAIYARWRACVGIPVVVRESIIPSIAFKHESSRWTYFKKRVKSFAFSRADAVVTVCKGALDDLVENFGITASRVRVVFNPAVPDDIQSLVAEVIDHPWFDGSSEVPVVCSVGRLSDQKDIPTTFRAIAEILKEREIRLVMVGEGPLLGELQSLTVELGIEQSVWFAGHQTNPYRFMAQSNVFVLSSIYEGIANVLAEALASGVPVVATDCPTGPTEVLLGGRAGRLVPVGDHVAVADAVRAFLDDHSLNESYRAAIAESLERFQPEVAAKAYVELIRDLTK